MRARKPWVRARLILLGWNVRFICLLPDCLDSGLWTRRKVGRQGYARPQKVSIEYGRFAGRRLEPELCGVVPGDVIDCRVFSDGFLLTQALDSVAGAGLQAQSTLWSHCIRELQAEMPEQQFNTWIRPLQAIEDDQTLRLLAPNRFVVDWLKEHHLGRISELVTKKGDGHHVVVEVGSLQATAAAALAPHKKPGGGSQRSAGNQRQVSRLNPTFTFDRFVEGKSNQLAKAAALQVGENPGKSYNPLFIYGGVGLGKTHLMQSIGNAILKRNAGSRVSYVHSERFVGDMVRGLQHNTISEFKGSIPHAGCPVDRRHTVFRRERSDLRRSFFTLSTRCWKRKSRLC